MLRLAMINDREAYDLLSSKEPKESVDIGPFISHVFSDDSGDTVLIMSPETDRHLMVKSE